MIEFGALLPGRIFEFCGKSYVKLILTKSGANAIQCLSLGMCVFGESTMVDASLIQVAQV